MENNISKIAEVLGLPFEVLEEGWAAKEDSHFEEIEVLQRCLVLLGYPTGADGKSWIDGVLGMHTRRALTQFQTENGLPASGQFDDPTRRALYGAAAQFLSGLTEDSLIGSLGQLQKVAHQPNFSGKKAVLYSFNEAAARVAAELIPAFLALISAINNGITVASIDLTDYRSRLAAGQDPKSARRLACRHGFLQLSGQYYQDTPELDLERVRVAGDLPYHYDVVAYLLKNNDRLRQAALAADAPGMIAALPTAPANPKQGLRSLEGALIEVNGCLNRPAKK